MTGPDIAMIGAAVFSLVGAGVSTWQAIKAHREYKRLGG